MKLSRTAINSLLTNRSNPTVANIETAGILLGIYIVFLFIVISLHRALIRQHKKSHERLVLLYDTIRYQLSKLQYQTPELGTLKGIRVVMEADHKNYLSNAEIIKAEIQKIEQTSGQTIVEETQRKRIDRQTNKKKMLHLLMHLLGRPITILTIGVYKLFR